MSPAPPVTISTHSVPPNQRARRWTEAVASSYFPLDLTFRDPQVFSGSLTMRGLGQVGVSRLTSDALSYRRRPKHLSTQGEDAFLVTIPRTTPVTFSQFGREVTCPRGGFVIERGNEPYVFSYAAASDLIALKVSRETLAARLSRPERYCAVGFGAGAGVGALLVDTVLMAEQRLPALSAAAASAMGEHVLNLIALAVDAGEADGGHDDGDVRRAHLARIDRVIAQRASEPGLGPSDVAASCGISLRHLHGLCSADGATVSERIRSARLRRARQALAAGERRSITDIALSAGFSDSAQFARAFRSAYGMTPTEARSATRR